MVANWACKVGHLFVVCVFLSFGVYFAGYIFQWHLSVAFSSSVFLWRFSVAFSRG